MNWSAKVRHMMSRKPVHLEIDDPPSRVQELLGTHGFHHLPVLQDGVLVGVVSAVDLARLSLGAWVKDPETEAAWLDATFTLGDMMTHEPECVHENDSIELAADRLSSGEFHCLPVLDDEGTLVGMLTSTDLLRWIVNA